jgi:ferredoxin
MKTYLMYFSPTGGVKKVIDIVTSEISVDEQIDLTDPNTDFGAYTLTADDVCVIGIPSFEGRVPTTALERIRQIKCAGGGIAVVVVVYGNRAYDDTLLELKTETEACGFVVTAAVVAVAEHSIMRQFGAGRPDERDEIELRGYAKEIAKLITERTQRDAFTVPGNTPYKKCGGVPLKPKAGKNCTKCGLCAEKCPVRAIPPDNPKSTDNDACVSCMRCIVLCPNNARKLNKAMLFAAALAMKKLFEARKQNELHKHQNF